jgi:hypothetical protein
MVQGNEVNNQNKVVKRAGGSEFLVDTTDTVNGHLFNLDFSRRKNLIFIFPLLIRRVDFRRFGVLFLFICHFFDLSERNR